MQTPCSNNLFPATGTTLATSRQIIKPMYTHGSWMLQDTGRPFIPVYGQKFNVSANNYEPLSIASNQNNKDTFLQFSLECYNASVNSVNGTLGSVIQGSYEQYLYKKCYSDANQLSRYNEVINIVWNFWNTANTLWSNDQYFLALSQLIVKLQNEADANLYIPNGLYTFFPTSDFIIDLQAWISSDADFDSFAGIEIYLQ
jgi:hypothetical protein